MTCACIPDFDRSGSSFISHEAGDLAAAAGAGAAQRRACRSCAGRFLIGG